MNVGVDSGQFSVLSVDDVDAVGLQTTQVDASRVTEDSDTESVDSIPDEEPQSPESGEVEDEEATPVTLQFGAAARAALAGLDRVDLEAEFTTRACVMKSPPAFVKGQYRAAMRFALVEVDRARAARDC